MKITAIRAHWLSVPIPEAQQHTSDFGRAQSFDATLVEVEVEVETDADITGYGEVEAAVGSAGTNAGLVTIVNEELAPLPIGEDPRQISRLRDVMYNGSRAHDAIAMSGALWFASGLNVLAEEDFTVVDGHREIPDRPGLGVTVNRDFVTQYRVAP